MDEEKLSDAEALWQDVITLLEAQHMPAATTAMLKSCVPVSLKDDVFVIETNFAFARKKILHEQARIETCLSDAAFQEMHLEIRLTNTQSSPTVLSTIPQEPIQQTPDIPLYSQQQTPPANQVNNPAEDLRPSNLLAEDIPESDSKLTFDRFVEGEENVLAFEAAKQVANGINKNYNPLFIYGKSGLGKTHLLRAIQNYIAANDPTRLCIYRSASQFVEDYRMSMNDPTSPPRNVLAKSYQDVDVLIIDDIQNMRSAAGSIRFFFETFNALVSHNKQVVLAADRAPSQLGMGESKFDERDTSRMDSGITVSIQVPDYELKLNLINAFYERMRTDAQEEHIPGMDGTISEDLRRLMASRSGASIRLIKGYMQSCLMLAHQKERTGSSLTREDVIHISQQKWPNGQRIVSVDKIQKAVERYYDISHDDLVGAKRNKELMEPRHVAVWLTREMTDNTLADIGKRFGNRSHATVKHSIAWVEENMDEDRIFYDKVETIKHNITDVM